MLLHLVFHDVYKDPEVIKRKIDVSLDYLLSLKQALDQLILDKRTRFSYYTFHFDEGYISFKNLVIPALRDVMPERIFLAVRTGSIGQENFLSEKDIAGFDGYKINIVSHSVSHPRLTLDGISTPQGGEYRDVAFGDDQLLSENEIYYQLNESKKTLENIVNHEVSAFALPFGGWNDSASAINAKYNLYKTVFTSEDGVDSGDGVFRPRYGIRNTKTIEQTITEILKLG